MRLFHTSLVLIHQLLVVSTVTGAASDGCVIDESLPDSVLLILSTTKSNYVPGQSITGWYRHYDLGLCALKLI